MAFLCCAISSVRLRRPRRGPHPCPEAANPSGSRRNWPWPQPCCCPASPCCPAAPASSPSSCLTEHRSGGCWLPCTQLASTSIWRSFRGSGQIQLSNQKRCLDRCSHLTNNLATNTEFTNYSFRLFLALFARTRTINASNRATSTERITSAGRSPTPG